MLAPPRTVVNRDGGLYALERALQRRGFRLVAGADEAGRGACAGPLVVGAVVLPEDRRGEIAGLADSKLLTAAVRERLYDEVVNRALAWSVVVIEPAEVDGRGLHVCNLAGMRRAIASLAVVPQYVLTDGFHVDGVSAPGLAVWKGDRVAACVAAASIIAKVTRDRIMVDLHRTWPEYGFDEHKGYATPEHSAALRSHGPCAVHRYSYANVAACVGADGAQSGARAGVPGGAAAGVPGGSPAGVPGVRGRRREGTVADAGVAARTQLMLGENVGMEGGSA